ncbi:MULTISPECIES: serine/threonine-protein kinase [Pseudanabaena]|uniref:Serine/threonine-protein kinase B n=2 Tax=Pseudanabaena TaxID=1152 RepID=L8MVS4_9CYAN|nr:MULTISPECIES: serine/threonine-protein kinase [Pseudanabaena]ELS30565.1 serine/threonine protein kinase with pentapeptide repeats [Pseudanabaena biceps PCC 7429]MDG3497163.1 serine/threonine-protein kinase [Pseudanabaena catenata USMAC16]
MSYCVNPNCANPNNEPFAISCASCGSNLKLRNRYRASRPLGKGGFGATFLAADEGLPGFPSCVIKQLRPNTQSASVMKMARELFEREAFTLGKIGSHPQIPRLLDYFEEDANFYLVQEFVDGETLKQEFERRGVFSEIEIRKVLTEIFPALGFMHQNGVIHRDIKPANIMRRKQDGQLVLIDFGAVSSQVNKPSAEEDPSGLLTNFAIGTPGFAPPEQMAMRPVYSSDLYATAMSCLYLMTGRSPKDLPHDPYTGEINWKSQVKLSDRLRVVFEKLLQQSVAQRFRSAEEALRALESGNISDEPPRAATPSANYQSSAPPSSVTVRPSTTQLPNSRIQPQKYGSGTQGTQFDNTGMMTTGNTRAGASRVGSGEIKGGRKVIVEYNQGKRNFANQDYSKAAFGSATLSGIVMSRSKLVEADFCHSDLTHASFQGANLSQAKLNSANLREAKMQRAVLVKADLGSASMILADMREANLQSAYMSKADLSGANLSGANLKGAYLSQANLNGTNLCGADLKGAKITDEQLSQAKTNWGTIRPDGSKRLF